MRDKIQGSLLTNHSGRRQGQGQDQDQGQGQDHLLLQRAALPPFLVLALTLVLTLELVQDSASQPYLSWITMFWITMFGDYQFENPKNHIVLVLGILVWRIKMVTKRTSTKPNDESTT